MSLTEARNVFILFTRKPHVFSEKYSSQEKNVKREKFLCKDKYSQNFLKLVI